MLDDKDEFQKITPSFELMPTSTLASIKDGAVKRLANKDFNMLTRENLVVWICWVDEELDRRGVCKVCFRYSVQDDELRKSCVCPD